MSKRSFVARHGYGHVRGQIFLGRALFCVGCEIIFTGSSRCPRCTSDETIWPLSEWLRSVAIFCRCIATDTPAAKAAGSMKGGEHRVV